MPPKIKITKEEIVSAALSLVREHGEQGLNARSIASSLHCSTQPVFSNFATMEELREATLAAAYEHYLSFLKAEIDSGIYPPYKAMGMAYIRFAKEEKALFHFIFMRDRSQEEASPSLDFEESVRLIMQANGVSHEIASLMHLELWACVHGIGTMLATSYLQLDWDVISTILTDVYQGIRAKYAPEETE